MRAPSDWRTITFVNAVAARGSVSLLRYLVSECGMDPNQCSARPLLAALVNNSDRNALYLINEAGADVNAASREGLTPLMQAAMQGNMEVLNALMAKGTDVDAVTREHVMAVGYAVQQKQAEAALHLLEEAGAAWDQPTPSCLLLVAARVGFFEFITPLLRHMRSKRVSDGDVAQHLAGAAARAIAEGLPGASLKALADAGLDLKTARGKAADGRMVPLFQLACLHNRADVAAFLLAQGCDPKKPIEG